MKKKKEMSLEDYEKGQYGGEHIKYEDKDGPMSKSVAEVAGRREKEIANDEIPSPLEVFKNKGKGNKDE